MEFKNLTVKRVMNTGLISFCRPKYLNALNTETLLELDAAIAQLEADESIYVVVITGEGKAFVSGADIYEMKDLTPDQARFFSQRAQGVFRKIELMEKPVIAAVNGYALGGGCELMMCCDIRIASTSARIGHPEVGLGITPGFGGTQRLPRLIGIARAKEFIFSEKVVSAEEAERVGLVNRVVAPEDLMDETLHLAGTIAMKSRHAVKYAKTAINRGIETDIATGQAIERDLFGLCFASGEQKEGMAAFVEKRQPKF
ncbi:MAG: enoyl-CoA hydratase/isomerase family protein [Spirochaetes bacterium]|nr:enoyl-CoA hydratase/isomerase family protein [Spirochaetota bacterium]